MAATAGLISYFASLRAPTTGGTTENWLQCNGALVDIATYGELYDVVGTRFGGDGVTTFALPTVTAPTGCIAIIATSASSVGPLIGQVMAIDWELVLLDWLECTGQRCDVYNDDTYMLLMEVVGTTFGGDRELYFNVPTLSGPDGVGKWLICYQGYFPYA